MTYPVKILSALHEVMTKVGYVQKTGTNKFQGYKYAGEGALLDKLRPAMVEAGLLLLPSGRKWNPIDEYGNMFIEVEYTLAHKDGDVWPDKIIAYGAGNDKNSKGGVGDKGLYKALTGANKYLLFKLFQLETGDDPEKDDAEIVTKKTNGAAKGSGGSGGGYVKPVTVPVPGETVTITVGDPKSAPGVSSAKEEVRQAIREVNACGDADSLTGLLPSLKDLCMKVAKIYPDVWVGEEEYSGLRGAIQKAGYDFMMAESVNKWLGKVDVNAGYRQ